MNLKVDARRHDDGGEVNGFGCGEVGARGCDRK